MSKAKVTQAQVTASKGALKAVSKEVLKAPAAIGDDIPFVTSQCCAGTICAGEWTVAKSLTSAVPDCVMVGDEFTVDYTITVTRPDPEFTLAWVASYTLHNPSTTALPVIVQIELLQGSSNIVLQTVLVTPLIPIPGGGTDGSFGILALTSSDSVPLGSDIICDNTFYLRYTLLNPSQPNPSPPPEFVPYPVIVGKEKCQAFCNLQVTCPDPTQICYCIFDTPSATGLNPLSTTFNGVLIPSETPTPFFTTVCASDFPTGQSSVDIDLQIKYKVLSCGDNGISFSNQVQLSVSTSGIPCEFRECDVVNQSTTIPATPSCSKPSVECSLTNSCFPKICVCKTSAIIPPCELQDCATKINALNASYPAQLVPPPASGVTEADFQVTSTFGSVPVNGLLSSANIAIYGPSGSPLANISPPGTGFTGWYFDIPDFTSIGVQYPGAAVSLADPYAAAAAIKAYYCDHTGQFPIINTDYLFGILQIFNNVQKYENTPGFAWEDIQVAISTLLFGTIDPNGPPFAVVIQNDKLPYTPQNVEIIIAAAVKAQQFFDASDKTNIGAAVCASLNAAASNNGIGGAVLLAKQPCVQILAIQFSLCDLQGEIPGIQLPNISYNIGFQVSEECATGFSFSLDGICPGATNFVYQIETSSACDPTPESCVKCSNYAPLGPPVPFDGNPVTVPSLTLPDGTTCVRVVVTFISALGTPFTIRCSQSVPAPTVANVCFSDCLTAACSGVPTVCSGCLSTAQYTITLNPLPVDCQASQPALQALLETLFPFGLTGPLTNLVDCLSTPFAIVGSDLLEILNNCGLNYTITFSNTADCCGLCLLIQNNISVLVGGTAECIPPSGCTKYTQQTSKLIDTIQFPPCASPTPVTKPALQEKKETTKKVIKTDEKKAVAKKLVKGNEKKEDNVRRLIIKQ